MNAKKCLVIGWDGATFDIIDPLVADGRMPHLAGLLARGMSGRLESTTPAVTPVAWTTFMTGTNPGKHGILDAFEFDRGTRQVRFISAARRRVKPVWSVLSERGRPSGALNVPVTYPPDREGGPVVSGMFTPSFATDFTHPPELLGELTARFGPYRESPKLFDDPGKYLDSLIEGVAWRAEVTMWLMDRQPLDLFCSVFMESDRVQHFFWKYRDPAHPDHARLGRAIERVYLALDAALGRILERTPADAAVALVSDHGAGPLRTSVFLNRWLMDQGLLTLRQDMTRLLTPRKPGVLGAMLRAAAKAVLPEAVLEKRRKARSRGHDRLNNLFFEAVDWSRSKAVSEGVGGGVYFNPDLTDPAEREALTRAIRQGLLALTDPATGAPAFTAVHRREDIFFGPATPSAPDLVTICAPGYQVIVPHEFLLYAKGGQDSVFTTHPWSGRHEQHGIFVLAGPGVVPTRLADPRMADVAPTLLYALGEDAPEIMDGRALTEGFEPDMVRARPPRGAAASDRAAGGEAATAPAAAGLSPEAEADIAADLKDLGYM